MWCGRKGIDCQYSGVFGECNRSACCNTTTEKSMASDTQNAYKDGYIRGSIDGTLLARKETAKEIFTKLIEVAKNNDNKISIGLLKAWAIEYGVEVEE